MASKQDVIDTSKLLREQLAGFAQDGRYSPDEREGFSRLQRMLTNTRTNFLFHAAHGDNSPAYDSPTALCRDATAKGLLCQPGHLPSQQSYYDAVHGANSAIKAETGPLAKAFRRAPVA